MANIKVDGKLVEVPDYFTLLQAAVAVVVLLFDAGIITPPVPRPKYDQHQQQYGQYSGGGYYGQQHGGQHGGPQQQGPQQQGLQQRPGYPTPYGGYSGSGQTTGGFPAQSGPPTPPTSIRRSPTADAPPGMPAPSMPRQRLLGFWSTRSPSRKWSPQMTSPCAVTSSPIGGKLSWMPARRVGCSMTSRRVYSPWRRISAMRVAPQQPVGSPLAASTSRRRRTP